MALKVEKRLMRWGHAYGIRFSRDEVENQLHARAGSKVRATVEPDAPSQNDVESLVVLRATKKARRYDVYKIIEEETGR